MKRYLLAVLFLAAIGTSAFAEPEADEPLIDSTGASDTVSWRDSLFDNGRFLTNVMVCTNYYLDTRDRTNTVVWTNSTVSDTRSFVFPPVTNFHTVTNYHILYAKTNGSIYTSVFYSNTITNYFIYRLTNGGGTNFIRYSLSNSSIGGDYFVYRGTTFTNKFIVFTNFVITGEDTNVTLTNVPEIYRFMDNFPKLVDITPYRTPDDIRISLLDYLFPVGKFHIFAPQPSWIEEVARRSVNNETLVSDASLLGFSNDLFAAALDKKKNINREFTQEEQSHLTFGFEDWDMKVVFSANITFKMTYGWIKKDENRSTSGIDYTTGFNMPSPSVNFNVLGKFGNRMSVNIEQSALDATSLFDLAYKALTTDTGLVRELRAGNVALNIPDSSHYVSYSGTTADNYGLSATLGRNKWSWQTVLSVTASAKGSKTFQGTTETVNLSIMDVSYIKRKYYNLPDVQIDVGSLNVLKLTTDESLADKKIDSKYFRKMTEGVDYNVDYDTGELTFANSLSRDLDIVVKYTAGGSFMTTNSNSVLGTEDTTSDKYLYIWKANGNGSQYMNSGYYNLGYKDFDISDGFTFSVVDTKTGALSTTSFNSSQYSVNSSTGLLKFSTSRPFPDPDGDVYQKSTDPVSADSVNTVKITLKRNVSSYMLDFGIVPGTEHVYVNGRELTSSEYTIIYSVGELIFKNSVLINDNDSIYVVYDYTPYSTASQQFSAASRFDWKPSKILNVGSTMVYNVAMRDSSGTAPSIASTPEAAFIMDADTTLNVGSLLGMDDRINFTVKAEGAMSVLDENSAGYANVEDFESSGSVYSLSSVENRWILAAPTTNIAGIRYDNRGQLFYKDYREYKLDGSYTLLDYSSTLSSDKIKEYGTKPGPYQVLGGHLDPTDYPSAVQSSLVMDYDFSGGNWVGMALSVAGPAGLDFSSYNEIVLWVKLQSDDDGDGVYDDTGTGQVDVALAVGNLNEDSDGDGVMDKELKKTDHGFPFNNALDPSLIDTYVGVGRLGEGDGYIQTEDLNLDSAMETNETDVVFPSAGGYTDVTNATVSQGGWQKVTIRISSLSAAQIALLEHVSSVGVYVKQRDGTKGRLLIDSVEFKSVKWQSKIIDGYDMSSSASIDQSSILEGEVISVYNDPLYAANRFYILNSDDTNANERANVFEKLHGPHTITEAEQMNEISMGLRYNLTNVVFNPNSLVGGTSAELSKTTSYSMDISRYRYFSFYFFVPTDEEDGTAYKSGTDTYDNENFVLILGNGEKSYYKWRIPLSQVPKNFWNKAVISITENMKIEINGVSYDGYQTPVSTGYPNLKDIDYVEFGVETTDTSQPVNKGMIWIDEVYVSQDTTVVGAAFYLNPRFESKMPLWIHKGTEILGPSIFSTVYELQNYNFVTTPGGVEGNMNNNLSVNLNQRLFKYLTFILSYNKVKTGTDTNTLVIPQYLQSEAENQTFNYSLGFNMPGKKYVPVVTHSFTETFYNGLSHSLVSGTNFDYILNVSTGTYSAAAAFNITEALPFNNRYSIQPTLNWGSLSTIEDYSDFTNDTDYYYLTNSSVYGIRSLKKSIESGLKVYLGNFYMFGGFTKEQKKFTKVYDAQGYRSLLDDLAHTPMIVRYADQLGEIFTGFNFENENLDYSDVEKYTVSLNANKLKRMEFLILRVDDGIQRTRGDYSYTASGALNARSERYTMSSLWTMIVGPTNSRSPLPKLNWKVSRTFNLSHNSTNELVEYDNALGYGDIYYMQPFYFNGFFNGDKARMHALDLVSSVKFTFADPVSTLADTLSAELILPNYKNVLLNAFPKRYSFASTLTTTKVESSFYQYRVDSLSSTFPIRFTAFFHFSTNAVVRPGDMNITLSYVYAENYNSRTNSNILKALFAQTVYTKANATSFTLSYAYAYYMNSIFSNSLVFSQNYGFDPTLPNASPLNRSEHTLTLTANWTITDIKDLKLWFIRINLRGSKIVNQDIFSFTRSVYNYDTSAFKTFDEKLYDFELTHSSQFQLTEMLSMTLLAGFTVNRYAVITPVIATDSFEKELYDPGIGFDLEADFSLKI